MNYNIYIIHQLVKVFQESQEKVKNKNVLKEKFEHSYEINEGQLKDNL